MDGRRLTEWPMVTGIKCGRTCYHNGRDTRPARYQSRQESKATRLEFQEEETECVNCNDKCPKCGSNIRSLFQNAWCQSDYIYIEDTFGGW
jgi:hypothetical protein